MYVVLGFELSVRPRDFYKHFSSIAFPLSQALKTDSGSSSCPHHCGLFERVLDVLRGVSA